MCHYLNHMSANENFSCRDKKSIVSEITNFTPSCGSTSLSKLVTTSLFILILIFVRESIVNGLRSQGFSRSTRWRLNLQFVISGRRNPRDELFPILTKHFVRTEWLVTTGEVSGVVANVSACSQYRPLDTQNLRR